jgi:quercetin dioxygenase-like cupin family protein
VIEFAPDVAAPSHRAASVDYIVVISGEIDTDLDESHVHLKAGDVTVQRSTIHNWGQSRSQAVRPESGGSGRGRAAGGA